jgi:hypothetical protein
MGMHLREMGGQVDMVFRTASVGGSAPSVRWRRRSASAWRPVTRSALIVTLASDSYKHAGTARSTCSSS